MRFKQRRDEDDIFVMDRDDHDSPAPEVGKVYKCFDDGKIRLSRLDYWYIDEAIDLDAKKVDKKLIKHLANAINLFYWLYSPEQHIIYKATMVNKDGSIYRYEESDEPIECYFLRTHRKEWFGAFGGFWDGLLDTDEYYYKKYIEEEE